jgi:hypothetical protein
LTAPAAPAAPVSRGSAKAVGWLRPARPSDNTEVDEVAPGLLDELADNADLDGSRSELSDELADNSKVNASRSELSDRAVDDLSLTSGTLGQVDSEGRRPQPDRANRLM